MRCPKRNRISIRHMALRNLISGEVLRPLTLAIRALRCMGESLSTGILLQQNPSLRSFGQN